MEGKIVVVTGANGFIASWIVKLLLERGYNVRGTVRNPEVESKVGHLRQLPGAKERLSLYKAELLGEEAYDEVIDGADFALNVLRSAAKAKTVKRVVYTSSTAAVYYSDRFLNRTEDDVVDESWWSDPNFCLKENLYYHAGKVSAERAAFDFAKDASFDVISILPCNVIGVVLQEILNWSSQEIPRLMKGIDRAEDRLALIQNSISFVDVEDVAMAHILAMETPNAEGRYLAVERCLTNDQLAVLLAKHYPEYSIVLKPDMEGKDEETFMKPLFKCSNEKLRNLGVNFTPISETVKKAVKCFQQRNVL